MWIIDATSNTINRAAQTGKMLKERKAHLPCTLALPATQEKYQKKHFASNAEQFVGALNVCIFLCFKYTLRLLKFCCTSAKT